jgi:hypothetical protein
MSPKKGKKRGGEGGGGRSNEKSKLSRIITELLDNAFSCTGSMRPYEDVESDFLRVVRCPITFSQNKYVYLVSSSINSAFNVLLPRCHLAAAYKRLQQDLQSGPSAELMNVAENRMPNVKAYEKLVTALFLDPSVSSVVCADRKNLVGDVDLRLYAVSLLLFAASGIRRQPNDSLLALCVSRSFK